MDKTDTITKPIIKYIKDTEKALAELEKKTLPGETEEIQDIIMNFPTVYIHHWPKTGKYEVYVGESNNIFRRTRDHYRDCANGKDWQKNLTSKKAMLYIIGHEHFNKSLTLDIENRLWHYLSSVEKVKKVHNVRSNPQNHYYPGNEFESIFETIWTELRSTNEELFPEESVVKDSAIFKASPLHKLKPEQAKVKEQILEKIEQALQKQEKQIIFLDGEAGTGKTVLNSSIFFDLYRKAEKNETKNFKCHIVVNHDEQVKVYADIAKKFGITDKYGKVVNKAAAFLNKHPEDNSVDVVFIDEAHLLFTQGNQGYRGKNQLDDIVKKAKVVVIVFDENQILRMDQYWESKMISKYRDKAIEQNNHFTLTEQLRMQADKETLHWIDSFTKDQVLHKIPHSDYEIRIFDSPEELETAIKEKANKEESKLSRLIANYDWAYNDGKGPEDRFVDYWEVSIGKWHKPWNKQLKKALSTKQKRKISDQSWAEQEHTINEVGSTYTIQGFDLNYAGVILGESVKYRNGRIEYDPKETKNSKVTMRKTMSDGSMQNFAQELLKHEVRVLMTRGVKGLYIYACNKELRDELKKAME